MQLFNIDHIVITAPSLDEGAAFAMQSLGVSFQPGGEHERMGTHNMLLRLGKSIYMEVIAPNPNAPNPQHPRWFELDNMGSISKPRIATWVARTSDIKNAVNIITEPLGQLMPMSRGKLNWLITIPSDGKLTLGGTVPALIEWHTEIHPASVMIDKGCSFIKLELFHPEPQRIKALLESMQIKDSINVCGISNSENPYIAAYINTPGGIKIINGK